MEIALEPMSRHVEQGTAEVSCSDVSSTVTIADIADCAGARRAEVATVLRSKKSDADVAEEVRQRILDTASLLNYTET